MNGVIPNISPTGTVLCLGAHCDDIEIGCGAALMTLQARHPALKFRWVIFSADDVREPESRRAAAAMLGSSCEVIVHRFRGSYFPQEWPTIKDAIETLKQGPAPDLVFTHFLHDRHQDHRAIAELTWNTFRDHLILEYEIAKYEGDLAHPNVYVPVTNEVLDRKVAALMECFPSQHFRPWFDAELFKGHMRLRGIECNAPSRYAEAFHGRKIIV